METKEKYMKDVLHNMIIDFRKKVLDQRTQGLVIVNYMKETGKSFSEVSRCFNIPKSTLHGYVKVGKIPEEDYKSLLHQGLSTTQIFNLAKYGKGGVSEKAEVTLNKILRQAIKMISPYSNGRKSYNTDHTTIERLHELKDMLNRVEMKIERMR